MSLVSELSTVTRENYMPLVVNQIYKFSPLLYRIFKISEEGKFGMAYKSDGGRKIVEPLEYQEVASASGSHGAYDGDDTFVADNQSIITAARYSWKTELGRSQLKILSNKGKAVIANPYEALKQIR